MNQITTKVDSDDKRMKINKFKLKKNHHWHSSRRLVHIYIYIYIYLSSLITNTILDCYSVFLLISRSPTLRVFLPLYTIFSFHDLHLPHADQIVGVDLCPISTFLKSLSSNYKAKSYCSGITSSSMRSES